MWIIWPIRERVKSFTTLRRESGMNITNFVLNLIFFFAYKPFCSLQKCIKKFPSVGSGTPSSHYSPPPRKSHRGRMERSARSVVARPCFARTSSALLPANWSGVKRKPFFAPTFLFVVLYPFHRATLQHCSEQSWATNSQLSVVTTELSNAEGGINSSFTALRRQWHEWGKLMQLESCRGSWELRLALRWIPRVLLRAPAQY